MALDFPTSPVNGQKYPSPAVAGQPVYTWDGEKWKAAPASTSATILVSDSPPANPPDNILWWESDSGLLYLRYNDGDTAQWVIAAPQPDMSTFVKQAGDTMTGHLSLPTGPVAANAVRKDYVDAADTLKADKTYVDTQDALKVAKAGDTMTGPLVLPSDPSAALEAATKQYVDIATTAAEYIANSAPTKKLTSGAVWTAAVPLLPAITATITPNFSSGLDFGYTLNQAGHTFANPTNVKVGQKGIFWIIQDGTGNRTITTWGSFYKFSGGTKPILSTTAGAVDVVSYAVFSSSSISCTFTADLK